MKEKILIVEDQFLEADYLRVMLLKVGYSVCGMANSVEEALDIIKNDRPQLVLLDIFLQGKLTGIDLARLLNRDNIPFVYISANSNEEILRGAKKTDPYGFLIKPFRERDLLVAMEIAFYRYEQSTAARMQTESNVKKELNRIEKAGGNWNEKVLQMARVLQQYVPFDCLAFKFKESDGPGFSGFALNRISFDEYQIIGIKELSAISRLSQEEISRLLLRTPHDDSACWFNGEDFRNLFEAHPMKALMAKSFGLTSNLILPFLSTDGYVFSLSLYRRLSDGYNAEFLDRLCHLQQQISSILSSIPTSAKKDAQSMKFTDPPLNNRTVEEFPDEVIGKSPAFYQVIDLVNKVATLDTSVLILGESGTGKEKIADRIQKLSPRKNGPFVKVNCAALPATLIESELFGHEKGAFTNAIEKRIGKFEQADHGTIFLDEIGELSPEFQVKLLRVLQEKEIERIGSKSSLKVDVRIIAATNRNLEKEVAEGRFRLDLYYRLNVFPIELPPLRDRKDDIPTLIYSFINRCNRKTGRSVTEISDKALQKMLEYHWPGNIRELEHLIERSILLAKDTVIEDVLLPGGIFKVSADTQERTKTIVENERDYILSVLKKCNGKIWGHGAAADILSISPSTLKSKMKKLGIRKEYLK